MAEAPSHYEVLGVPRTASDREIRAAYERVAQLVHPDRGGSTGLFQLVQQAWHVLQDASARRAYDASLGGMPASADTSSTDFFWRTEPPLPLPIEWVRLFTDVAGGRVDARAVWDTLDDLVSSGSARPHEVRRRARHDLSGPAEAYLCRMQAEDLHRLLGLFLHGRLDGDGLLEAAAVALGLVS